jgi:hypothetical protein
MSESENTENRNESLLPVTPQSKGLIPLGNNKFLDASQLSENDRNELVKAVAKGEIEAHKKALELEIANSSLVQRLDDMSGQVAKATNEGASATITGAYSDSMGRTEVIMGNTEAAANAKGLNRSQRGDSDNTLTYVIIGAIVAVLIALIVFAN